jgi:predicted nucleotide-binding protein
VIFELGLFLGLLGRDRVVALYEAGVEMPSDYSGVMWVPISGEGWMLELATEMKAAGIKVSLDEAI